MFVCLMQYWNDLALRWNPADYNNITAVHLLANRIWKPDITLYNESGLSDAHMNSHIHQ